MTQNKPTLLLLPNLIAENRHHEMFLPASVDKAVATLDGLISESEKEGRRYLSRFQTKKPPHEIPLALYNTHTPDEDIDFYLEPLIKGERWGIISDSGLPCIADPGAKIVSRARAMGIQIQAFVGPSSIFLALMHSGLSGQCFTFQGYLDKDQTRLARKVKELENESKRRKMTQIFMERPYMNQKMLETLLDTLEDETMLCVARELTGPDQKIQSQSVAIWKKSPLPNIDKKNTLFLLLA